MSLHISEVPQHAHAARRSVSFAQIVGFVSVTLFISIEIATASVAGIWSLSGLFHLNTVGEIVLSVIIGLPAVYAILRCGQLAYEAETDPQNQ